RGQGARGQSRWRAQDWNARGLVPSSDEREGCSESCGKHRFTGAGAQVMTDQAVASSRAPLEVRGVSRRFEETVALSDVSFTVNAGELFGLVGPDGAGKTTLFRILTTLLVPDAGTATVLGLDVVRDLWAIRSRVGYMPG